MTSERPGDVDEISPDDESWVRSTLRAAVVDAHPPEDLVVRAQASVIRSGGGASRTWLLRAAAVAVILAGAAVVIQLADQPTRVDTTQSPTTDAPTTTVGLPPGRTLELTGVSRLADGQVDVTLTLTPTAPGSYRVAAIYGSMQDPDRSAEVAAQVLDGQAGEAIELHLVFAEPPSLSVPPELGTTDRVAGYVAYTVSSGGAVVDLALGRLPDTTGLPVAEATSLLRLYSQSVSTRAGTCEPGIVCEVTVLSGSIPPFAAPDGQVSLSVGVPTSVSP